MNNRDTHNLGFLGGFGFGIIWAGAVTSSMCEGIFPFLAFFFVPVLLMYFVFLRYLSYDKERLEKRAEALKGWTVGIADSQSFIPGIGFIHYAYPPKGCNEKRVPFIGTPTSALRDAVKFAEKRNRKYKK